jgi:hypothetical protein
LESIGMKQGTTTAILFLVFTASFFAPRADADVVIDGQTGPGSLYRLAVKDGAQRTWQLMNLFTSKR